MALIVKARDTRNTTSVIVTHRYQDGHIMANFRYNPDSAQIEAATSEANGLAARTRFMVFGQGKLVFVGTQQELDDSEDPYISKFRSVKS
jgi:phospholipid/cholesterol/gamma-HCH transport system ATP-binding protein